MNQDLRWRDILRDRDAAVESLECVLRLLEKEVQIPLDLSPGALERSIRKWNAWLEAQRKAEDRLRSIALTQAARHRDLSAETSPGGSLFLERVDSVKKRSARVQRLLVQRMAAVSREITSRPARRPRTGAFQSNQPSLLDIRA